MYNYELGHSTGLSVKRHVKRKAIHVQVNDPKAQVEYTKYFNAVNQNDRDGKESIHTNRYYIHIFC